jgi:hypothetical protein
VAVEHHELPVQGLVVADGIHVRVRAVVNAELDTIDHGSGLGFSNPSSRRPIPCVWYRGRTDSPFVAREVRERYDNAVLDQSRGILGLLRGDEV